jgi:hypothetical protein
MLDRRSFLVAQAAFDQIWPIYAGEFEHCAAARAEAREKLVIGILTVAASGILSERHLVAGGHRAMLRYRNQMPARSSGRRLADGSCPDNADEDKADPGVHASRET